MIDASRSQRAAWQRYLTALVMVALVASLTYLIWVKELHHALG